MTNDAPKIFARNLTARAVHRVAGNPDISRPEDTVANCFPGLDMDLRNLDRRFFPGLVFEFVSGQSDTDPWQGARLLYCDALGDPDLQPEYLDQLEQIPADYLAGLGVGFAGVRRTIRKRQRALLAQLHDPDLRDDFNSGAVELTRPPAGATPADGAWFLDWIQQGRTRIAFYAKDTHGVVYPLDGASGVWRLVRSLLPGGVKIGLRRRMPGEYLGDPPAAKNALVLKGWRRLYTSPLTGVLSNAYQPGELTMSMCSPWQHDFRDCACHYWASNRPDVVYGEVAEGEPILPGGASENPERATTRLDWMRADRSVEGAAQTTMFANRPFQMDHFQISQSWQSLNIVLRNTEIGAAYTPPPAGSGTPFSPDELYKELQYLAGVEMTLALEYLYASFSLIADPKDIPRKWPDALKHADMARHYLRLTAVSEMQHLRWVNELLWSLKPPGLPPIAYAPVLSPAPMVPDGNGRLRPRALRPLTRDTLDVFIAVEKPSSGGNGIDGAYTRVVATLARGRYPPNLHELASRIANDGTEHYSRLENLRLELDSYGAATPWLRPTYPSYPTDREAAARALALFGSIQQTLTEAYDAMAAQDFAKVGARIEASRRMMNDLLAEGDALARQGIGIPFWDP